MCTCDTIAAEGPHEVACSQHDWRRAVTAAGDGDLQMTRARARATRIQWIHISRRRRLRSHDLGPPVWTKRVEGNWPRARRDTISPQLVLLDAPRVGPLGRVRLEQVTQKALRAIVEARHVAREVLHAQVFELERGGECAPVLFEPVKRVLYIGWQIEAAVADLVQCDAQRIPIGWEAIAAPRRSRRHMQLG
eukprot:scaffold120555_cov28-Tisochrysis_lutea.AAC.3